MIEKVRTYINRYALLTKEEPVLVGLSGGADSVALLAVLKKLGYTCIALHCNFHLRDEESNRDEVFAKRFAREMDVPFYKTDFDTYKYATANYQSIEMAARELRYEWFEVMRKRLGAQAIAVGHHRDDNVETFLINLTRGTGIKGLRGIRPKNGYIVRPLLNIGKDEILGWVELEGLTYMTDSTNLSDAYTRNFIRLKVLPLLKKINPSVKEAIARTSEHLADVEAIYLACIEEAKKTVIDSERRLNIDKLLSYPSPQTILYELLLPYGFGRQAAQDIFQSLKGESGRTFFTPEYRLVKDRDYLLITRNEPHTQEEYVLEPIEGEWRTPISLATNKTEVDKYFVVSQSKYIASFDYDKLRFPLTIRRWRKGDWFVPFGMKGRKKLSDYFTDHKFSLPEKENVWLLCSGDDIIWIIGERTDDRFRIDNKSKDALLVIFFK